jgi:hypothetical protein
VREREREREFEIRTSKKLCMGMGEQDWTSYLSVSKGAKSRDGLKKR